MYGQGPPPPYGGRPSDQGYSNPQQPAPGAPPAARPPAPAGGPLGPPPPFGAPPPPPFHATGPPQSTAAPGGQYGAPPAPHGYGMQGAAGFQPPPGPMPFMAQQQYNPAAYQGHPQQQAPFQPQVCMAWFAAGTSNAHTQAMGLAQSMQGCDARACSHRDGPSTSCAKGRGDAQAPALQESVCVCGGGGLWCGCTPSLLPMPGAWHAGPCRGSRGELRHPHDWRQPAQPHGSGWVISVPGWPCRRRLPSSTSCMHVRGMEHWGLKG